MDALSDILATLKLEDYGAAGFDAAGAWCIDFPQDDGIRFYAVISGSCWLAMENSEPMLLKAGDCVLLPHGRAFRLATDLAVAPQDAYRVFADARGSIAYMNGGGELFGVGGFFETTGFDAPQLRSVLPPIVQFQGDEEKSTLRWCIDRMQQELRAPQPGGVLIARHLATMILVAALRLCAADAIASQPGWLSALSEPRMAKAINAIHERPSARWSVESLASCAGMSRTSFATAFKSIVGIAPMEYVTQWRMTLAASRLKTTRDSIAEIAYALGYESESAFSAAFKRRYTRSPRAFAADRQPN